MTVLALVAIHRRALPLLLAVLDVDQPAALCVAELPVLQQESIVGPALLALLVHCFHLALSISSIIARSVANISSASLQPISLRAPNCWSASTRYPFSIGKMCMADVESFAAGPTWIIGAAIMTFSRSSLKAPAKDAVGFVVPASVS